MPRIPVPSLMLYSFLLLLVSTIALFIPTHHESFQDQMLFRIAWKELHIAGAFLFLAALVYHIAPNWRRLAARVVSILKNHAPLMLLLAVALFAAVGALFGLEPLTMAHDAVKTTVAAKPVLHLGL